MAAPVRAPDVQQTVGPLIPALRAAAVSLQPAETVLPLLTPILRQRVQLLSFRSTNDPWIRLLCYETANVPRLTEIALSERLEPHPVSGEIEIDWDYDVETRYRRLDEDTLQALVIINVLELAFRLVYCTLEGEEDGWKVGEVTVADKPSSFSSFEGVSTVAEAEEKFSESRKHREKSATTSNGYLTVENGQTAEYDDDDDDEGYWARYDATPGAKTPDPNPNKPAPRQDTPHWSASDENDYFSQYDDVQPAMDNHDPDEETNFDASERYGSGMDAASNGHFFGDMSQSDHQGSWREQQNPMRAGADESNLLHPLPRSASSASSHRSVEKLEAAAARQEQNDFGVKQHISRSIKSLFLLSRASGIDREEFERLVKTELDTLGMLED